MTKEECENRQLIKMLTDIWIDATVLNFFTIGSYWSIHFGKGTWDYVFVNKKKRILKLECLFVFMESDLQCLVGEVLI